MHYTTKKKRRSSWAEESVRKISTIFNFKQGETILNFSQRPLSAMWVSLFRRNYVLVYRSFRWPKIYLLYIHKAQVSPHTRTQWERERRVNVVSVRQTEKENQSARKCIVPRISGHRKTKTSFCERSTTTTAHAKTTTMQNTEGNKTENEKQKKKTIRRKIIFNSIHGFDNNTQSGEGPKKSQIEIEVHRTPNRQQ